MSDITVKPCACVVVLEGRHDVRFLFHELIGQQKVLLTQNHTFVNLKSTLKEKFQLGVPFQIKYFDQSGIEYFITVGKIAFLPYFR